MPPPSQNSQPPSGRYASSRPPAPVPPDAPRLLLVDDARFDQHTAGAYHPERPERLAAARAAVARSALFWDRVDAREATRAELERVHDGAFLDGLEKLRGARGYLDPDTYVGPASVEAAKLAAGGLTVMVDRMLDGASADTSRGVALLRPPGHHARPAHAMGFCLVNNVAVAAAHAVARGLERVLVLDWDVHHGNGTQEIFWRDPHVLYMSTHQYPFYPGTGAATEIGEGAGEGYTVNVPLTAHGADGVYRAAFEQVLLPIAEAYAPELVLVSAGFDAATRDPLAQMDLSADAFGWMAAKLAKVAEKSAKGRIALVLEGGYDLVSIEAGLSRAIAGIAAPDATLAKALAAREADAHQASGREDVARARAGAKRAWAKVV
jgi:acetoin utilization deacetylase AcuC-like enzyme